MLRAAGEPIIVLGGADCQRSFIGQMRFDSNDCPKVNEPNPLIDAFCLTLQSKPVWYGKSRRRRTSLPQNLRLHKYTRVPSHDKRDIPSIDRY
ncbi:unnamed protein product [Wuchereria bancrofti]|uniref:Uncharacterized protein n=1 Tax=Wuchereria bancrofti TaxID=6293 RepID=A0A3P7E4T6_WUCBA|nr:unnamed protein product [Wuchereria bancrofti]